MSSIKKSQSVSSSKKTNEKSVIVNGKNKNSEETPKKDNLLQNNKKDINNKKADTTDNDLYPNRKVKKIKDTDICCVETKNPKLLIQLLNSLKGIIDIITFKINPDKKEFKMSGEGFAASIRIIITLKDTGFTRIESKNPNMLIHLKLTTLIQFTKCFEKYPTMKMHIKEKSGMLEIVSHTENSFDEIKLKLTESPYQISDCSFESDIVVTISAKWFKEVISCFSQAITGTGSIEITVTKSQIMFSCMNDIKNEKKKSQLFTTKLDETKPFDGAYLCNPESVEDELCINHSYVLDSLMLMPKFKDLTGHLNFFFLKKKKSPLAIHSELCGNDSSITIFISPLEPNTK